MGPNVHRPAPEVEDSRPIFPQYYSGEHFLDEKLVTIDLSKYDLQKVLTADAKGDVVADTSHPETPLLSAATEPVTYSSNAVDVSLSTVLGTEHKKKSTTDFGAFSLLSQKLAEFR